MLSQKTGPRQYASLLIRLWLEPGQEGTPRWRSYAYHIQRGEQRYFDRLEDLLNVVAEWAQVALPGDAARTSVREEIEPAGPELSIARRELVERLQVHLERTGLPTYLALQHLGISHPVYIRLVSGKPVDPESLKRLRQRLQPKGRV